MKQLSWSKVTVGQFIEIQKLSLDKELDDIDKAIKTVSILYNMDEKDVEELTEYDFNCHARECGRILNGKIEGSARRFVMCGKKKYKVIYEVSKLKHRQYVEIQHFSSLGMEENIHLIMASLVQPVLSFGRIGKNIAEDHSKYANDLLNASIVDIYHSCVFFCRLYLDLMERIKASLVVKMMEQGARKDQAMELLNNSINAMAGFIAHEKPQHSKA